VYRDNPQASPPSDWELVRGWLTRTYQGHRALILFAANIIITLVALTVFNALRPIPQRLTQRDIDAAVDRSLENAPPKPSNASIAYDAILPSVVAVFAVVPGGEGKSRSSMGSGVVVVDTGIILTCLHVVRDATKVMVVFSNGMEAEALVMTRQPENDLAVLSAMQIPDELKAATLVSSASLHVGDEVIAVGNPFGILNSVSDGVVSGLGREYTSRETGMTLRNLIQFDAAVNPGNSGGPLINRNGEVVGLVTSLLNPTSEEVFIGIGFAVPIDTAGGAIGSPPI
jgi:S1-C subfamily serine protease